MLSRRAGGISIGVNLNIDKICNFHCIYCQVDRGEVVEKVFVNLPRLRDELDRMIELVTSGRLFAEEPFRHTPEALRRLNDIALSGDGEPTTYTNFADVVGLCAEVRQRHRLDQLKLVLITNASMFHREAVPRALEVLDANNGEIWAKLDAGTEAYYRRGGRARCVSFRRILDNLLLAARARPIVIQSLFMRLYDAAAHAGRARGLLLPARASRRLPGAASSWCRFTPSPARPPKRGSPRFPRRRSNSLAELVRLRTGLPVAAFYGSRGT